jgi:hypothetical protein
VVLKKGPCMFVHGACVQGISDTLFSQLYQIFKIFAQFMVLATLLELFVIFVNCHYLLDVSEGYKFPIL